MSKLTVLLGLAFLVAVSSATIIDFTGDVFADFHGVTNVAFPDPHNNINNLSDQSWSGEIADVGVPQGVTARSGWDMRAVYMNYHRQASTDTGVTCVYDPIDHSNTDCGDIMQIGIDCYGICGDADGDGNQGSAGSVVAGNGGDDLNNLDDSETFALMLDVQLATLDNEFSFLPTIVIGWDSAIDGDASVTTFGVYDFDPNFRFSPPAGFQNPVTFGFQNRARFPSDTDASVDVEMEIYPWAGLFDYVNNGNNLLDPVFDDITIKFNVFAGSFQDDGVGEDFIPNNGDGETYTWEGCVPDVCGLCPDDSNYGLGLDDCNLCPGDNGYGMGQDSCGLCPIHSQYNNARDECGECFGPGRDECNLCNFEAGYGTCPCCGCDDVPFSGLIFDECEVCGGDGSSCCEPEEYKGYWMWEIDQMLTYYNLINCHEELCVTIGLLEESMDLTYNYWWWWQTFDTEPLAFCDYLEIIWWFNDCLAELSTGLTSLSAAL